VGEAEIEKCPVDNFPDERSKERTPESGLIGEYWMYEPSTSQELGKRLMVKSLIIKNLKCE
jgi:hypothetical protein